MTATLPMLQLRLFPLLTAQFMARALALQVMRFVQQNQLAQAFSTVSQTKCQGCSHECLCSIPCYLKPRPSVHRIWMLLSTSAVLSSRPTSFPKFV